MGIDAAITNAFRRILLAEVRVDSLRFSPDGVSIHPSIHPPTSTLSTAFGKVVLLTQIFVQLFLPFLNVHSFMSH